MNSVICMVAENSDNWMSDFWESKIEKVWALKRKYSNLLARIADIQFLKIKYIRDWSI